MDGYLSPFSHKLLTREAVTLHSTNGKVYSMDYWQGDLQMITLFQLNSFMLL